MNTAAPLLEVHRASTLGTLASDPPAVRRDYSGISLGIGELRPGESAAWERLLNRPIRSTGSGTATLTMLLTTVAWVLYLFVGGHTLTGDLSRLLQGAAIVVCSAALGKVVGLFYWNLVFRRNARRLGRVLAQR